jgi:hypothetical protein
MTLYGRTEPPRASVNARPDWRRVIIVASGPSFTEDQVPAIETAQRHGFKVLAVNDNYRRCPFADLLFAADPSWWNYHAARVRAAGFLGELWTQSRPAAEKHRLRYVRAQSGRGLCKSPATINGGGSSGYMAIGLAWLFGARDIVLVGFDCKNTGGALHWFGPHPAPLANMGPYPTWLACFPELAKDLDDDGVSVVITGETALQCWRKADLKTYLAAILC